MKRIAIIISSIVFSVIAWSTHPQYDPQINNSRYHAPRVLYTDSNTLSLFQVQKMDIDSYITETGSIQYRNIFTVNSEVGGELKKCSVKAGDIVKVGDLLIIIENEELLRRKDTICQSLEQAKTALINFQKYTKVERATNLKLQFQQAQVKYDTSLKTFNHSDELLNRGMISKKEFEQIKLDFDNSKTLLDLQRLKSEKLLKLEKEEEKKLINTVELIEREAKKIEEEKSALNVFAPVSGKILKLSDKFPTEYWDSNAVFVSKGQFVATIANEKGRYVELKLFGDDIKEITVNDPVEIFLTGNSDKIIEGKVQTISPTGQSYGQYKRYPVIVDIITDADFIRPGSLVRCRFLSASRKNTISIPVEFLFYKQGKKYCRVKENESIIEKTVTTGIDNGKYIEIIDGLKNGEEIIL
ncbi:MAG: HlyD family efflux transporter periplasmic adaptor subunit [Candidatus Aureabacteria bacterium]|nr:HlyD family efflux transporter periplasmic adaptor subunit [Candidatus Auribacterota bacterium]